MVNFTKFNFIHMKSIKWVKRHWLKSLFILSGILSLFWFLIRVIPKPGRVFYPCQRAAFPIASTFVIWLIGCIASFHSFRNAKKLFRNRKFISLGLFAISIALFLFSFLLLPPDHVLAKTISFGFNEPVLKVNYDLATDQLIDPQAKVSIVKSEESDVVNIDKFEVETMVREAVNEAGGLDDIITDGDTVVLKPNIVLYDYRGLALSTSANGMVTDWRVVAATAKIVRELDPHGTIFVMEGTGGASTSGAYMLLNYTKALIPEVDAFLALEDVSGNFQEFSSDKLVAITLPEGVKLYPDNLKTYNSPVYYLNKIYYNADVLISLPVLKNHETAGTTGAVKNLGIGATPANIYGAKSGTHARWYSGTKPPINHTAYYLHRWIHDFYAARPADFAIMDGLQGYAYGPNYNYQPPAGWGIRNHQQNMRVILASKDPIALDAIEALVSGDDPLQVSHLVYLNNDGLGCADANAIKVLGTRVHSIKKNFPHVVNESDSDAKDFSAPGSRVHYVHYDGNLLNLSLLNAADVTKVEIEIDNQDYNKIIVNGFDNISVDIGDYNITDSVLTVYAQDRFLNSDVFKITGNFENNTTSMPRLFSDKSLHIYPNPADDFIIISMNNSYSGKLNMAIYDQTGRQLLKLYSIKQAFDFSEKINVSGLAKGDYLITVTAAGAFCSGNICKK
jgi:uncharacterized protein (DUF362 family)